MSDKNKKTENDYFAEKVVEDEMQKTLSYELEHKSFRMQYILNMIIMFIVYAVFTWYRFSDTEVTAGVQVIIMLFYVAMLFSLSLYNYRAARIGVLDAFASQYQKGVSYNRALEGEQRPNIKMYLLSAYSLTLPASGLGSPASNRYFKFFLVWLILAFSYEIFTALCVDKNHKVREKQLADEENEEE